MATMPERYVKQVLLGSDTYELIAGFLNDGAGGVKDWADVEALVTAGFTIVAPWVKSDYESATAPTAQKLATVPAITVYYNDGESSATGTLDASASESKKHIYLVYHPHESGDDKFDEYVANGSTWEKIGNTDVDLSNYAEKGTYTGTAASNGSHTHTVTGSVTVPTVAKTNKNLNISKKTDVALDTSDKNQVLGSSTSFDAVPTDADTTKLVVTSVNSATSVPKKASKASEGAPVNIPNVTANVASNASTIGDEGTAVASFSATVVDGVLSFAFASKKFTTSDATKTILGTAIPITSYTFEDVDCSEVSTIAVNVASGQVADNGTGASIPTNAIKAVSVSASSNDLVSALTNVTVSAQPEFELDGNATSGVSYVDSVTIDSDSVAIDSGVAASAGEHTHTTSTTLS